MTNTVRTSPFRKPAQLIASGVLALTLALGGCATTTAITSASGTSSAATSTAAATASATDSTTASASTTAETIANTTAAAEAFLATLTEEQQAQLVYAYDDETKSTSWSNFPVTFVARAGLNLTDLTEEQQAAALSVLEALLSDEAYTQVVGIMAADQFLLENSSSTEESLGQYYLAFFGDPSDTGSWAVQFGGHHLGLNADLNGTDGSITFAPTHLGVQPAVYTDADGNEVQPFAAIYSAAFAFYDSLTDEQKAALYQGSEVASMVCAPGGTCDYPTGTGLSASELTDEQRQLLLDLAAQWVGLADDETTAAAMAEIEATLDDTWVTWSGATTYDMTSGDGISFSISGPDVYIEFASQSGSAGADVSGYTTEGWGHVHTIYRDPSNDYAGSVTQAAASGMGGGGKAPGGTPPGNG